MSIIYDALKKVEKSEGTAGLKVKAEKKSKPKPKTYLIYILVVCFGFFIASVIFSLFGRSFRNKQNLLAKKKSTLSSQPQPTPDTTISSKAAVSPPPPIASPPGIAEPQKEPSPAFVLNGVFFSQDEGYALINNQIVEEGDQVDGATVVKIALNQVELNKEGSTIKLSNQSR